MKYFSPTNVYLEGLKFFREDSDPKKEGYIGKGAYQLPRIPSKRSS